MCFTDTFLFCSQLRSVTMLCFADLHVTLATHLSKTTKETEKNWRFMIGSQDKKFQSPWNWENIQHNNQWSYISYYQYMIIPPNRQDFCATVSYKKKWGSWDQPWITVSSLLKGLTFTSPDDACWTRSAWCASSTACAARSCKAPKSSTSNKPHCHFRSWFGSLVNQPTCGLYQLYLINSN